MPYKAVGRSIIKYDAPVWGTNLRNTNYKNIKYTENDALRISTGCHKMSNVDHLHAEANGLKVREHSELLSAQYLARCLEPENVNNSITTKDTPKRRIKERLFTRHHSNVELMMIANDRKAIHTKAVNKAVNSQRRNVVLDVRPPLINVSEKELTRKKRTTLAQLRSGHCKLLGSYKIPHDVKHLFNCPAHPTKMTPSDLWNRPVDAIRELSYIKAGVLD